MKEEIGKLTETVVRSGQAVISGLKSETDKLIDEAVAQMDDKKKKTWSGYDSIQLKEAPDTVVPGCLVLEGGSFRGCYTSGVLDVLMENGINLQTTIGTSAGALNGYNYVAGEIGRAAKSIWATATTSDTSVPSVWHATGAWWASTSCSTTSRRSFPSTGSGLKIPSAVSWSR